MGHIILVIGGCIVVVLLSLVLSFMAGYGIGYGIGYRTAVKDGKSESENRNYYDELDI